MSLKDVDLRSWAVMSVIGELESGASIEDVVKRLGTTPKMVEEIRAAGLANDTEALKRLLAAHKKQQDKRWRPNAHLAMFDARSEHQAFMALAVVVVAAIFIAGAASLYELPLWVVTISNGAIALACAASVGLLMVQRYPLVLSGICLAAGVLFGYWTYDPEPSYAIWDLMAWIMDD